MGNKIRAMLGNASEGLLLDGSRFTYRANKKGVRTLRRKT